MAEKTRNRNGDMKKNPYGLADYERIIRDGYYYVDKTSYFATIKAAGNYLFFIRPRRFGKSLFLSTMETYYDIAKAESFDSFYKGTNIFQNPTQDKNSYLILKFNFSEVESSPDRMETSFVNNIRAKARSFLFKYSRYFPSKGLELLQAKIEDMDSAADILLNVVELCGNAGQQVYIIIDEYDNFANTLLSQSGSEDYHGLTHGDSFFRTFFKVLKGGATGSGAPISRLFITGVSPVTLDDVTSGFNIGKNVSTDPAFNELLGFTTQDVEEMIDYYRGFGKIKHETAELMDIMTQWYDQYRFSAKTRETLFNPDMVLYFLDEYFKSFEVPDDLIDRNVRTDYQKLRHLIIIDRNNRAEANGNFARLREILEEGEIAKKLKKGFPLEEVKEPENFVSLLFYLGLLTIAGEREGLTLFKIPNQTVKHLYYDYIIRVSRETGLLDVNAGKLESLLHEMAYRGRWRELFNYLAGRMEQSVSIRDFFREEKVIQGFLLAYLGISDFFILHSEKEMNRGYADIVMEPFLARYEGIKYAYLLEIKFIPGGKQKKPGTVDKEVQRLRKEAEEQLNGYALDEKFLKSIGKCTLVKLVLIFHGRELIHIGEA